jgi:hypothetical protein
MSVKRGVIGGVQLALVLPCLVLPGLTQAQQRPFWISTTPIVSTNGLTTLRWSVKSGDSVTLFRISEEYSGEQQVSYTDLAELQLHRHKPGKYTFVVQVCHRFSDGYAKCGEASSKLTLAVQPGGSPQ